VADVRTIADCTLQRSVCNYKIKTLLLLLLLLLDKFQDPSQQLPSYLITGLRPVFNIFTALFIVCCTAFSLHICLLTRGAILLGIESAPLSEDEDKMKFWQ